MHRHLVMRQRGAPLVVLAYDAIDAPSPWGERQQQRGLYAMQPAGSCHVGAIGWLSLSRSISVRNKERERLTWLGAASGGTVDAASQRMHAHCPNNIIS